MVGAAAAALLAQLSFRPTMLDRVPDPQLALAKALHRALALLRRPRFADRSVHEIRREIKRARAALRLLRDALGKEAYARENAALRDAGRRLSAVRDARVVQETLERVAKRGSGPLRRRHTQ
ncbi:MAG: CHAD domain-containing protein, partial [Burkholderiales bacterium]